MIKQKFLTCYDYGTGGVWTYVWAANEAQIHEMFPDLLVFSDLRSLHPNIQKSINELPPQECDIDGELNGFLRRLLIKEV